MKEKFIPLIIRMKGNLQLCSPPIALGDDLFNTYEECLSKIRDCDSKETLEYLYEVRKILIK